MTSADTPENHPIHSGTARGGSPGDARGPDSPPSQVRNPELSETAQKTQFRPESQGGLGSPVGQGYWVHDQLGPRAYVAPVATPAESGTDSDLVEMAEVLALTLGALPEGGAQSVMLGREDGQLTLFGSVTSEVMRRAALRCVRCLTVEPVRDSLNIR